MKRRITYYLLVSALLLNGWRKKPSITGNGKAWVNGNKRGHFAYAATHLFKSNF
jgi:hypothetical protein